MKVPKKCNKSDNHPLSAVIFEILTYANMYINQTHNLCKSGEDTTIQT